MFRPIFVPIQIGMTHSMDENAIFLVRRLRFPRQCRHTDMMTRSGLFLRENRDKPFGPPQQIRRIKSTQVKDPHKCLIAR